MNVACIALLALAVADGDGKGEENKEFHRSAKKARAQALEKKQPCVILVSSDMWAL